jgi:hypothetical protein
VPRPDLINGGIHGPPVIFDEAKAYSFGLFLGERYLFTPFIVGGDTNRYWNENGIETINRFGDLKSIPVKDFGAITESMVRGLKDGQAEGLARLDSRLREEANGYETFITYHSTQGWPCQRRKWQCN